MVTMTAVQTRVWDEARALLDVPGLPLDPKMLPRPARVKIATVLAEEGWPQRLIGEALGVERSRISRWLNGDVRTWPQVAGRGPSTKARAKRSTTKPTPAPVQVERWPNDEPIPRSAREGWGDDEDELDELEAPPRQRSAPKPAGLYGAMTPMVVAALRRGGHQVNDDGTPVAKAPAAAAQTAAAPTAPAAPETIPLAPAVTSTWTPPGGRSAPAPAIDASTVAVELECGHVERNLPLDGPWVQRRWVACTRCNLAHRRIRRRVR